MKRKTTRTQNTQNTQNTKVCSDCKRTLPLTSFGKNKSSKDGLTNICLECKRKRNSETNTNKHKYIKTLDDKYRILKSKMKRVKPLELEKSMEQKIKNFFDLKADIEFNEKYITPGLIKEQNLELEPTAIQSVMGTGKTQYVLYFIQEALKQDKRVLYICPNIITTKSTQEFLIQNGLKVFHYLDPLTDIRPEVVISTVDSCDDYLDYDVLIIDEVLSLFSETDFKIETSKDKNKVLEWNTRYENILKHKCPIILDRYINPVLGLFDVGVQGKFTVIKNNFKKNKIINDLSFMKLKEVLELALLYIRDHKTVSFHSNMISVVEKLEHRAKEQGLNPKVFTSKTDTGLETLKEYQELIISTSRLARGVSANQEIVFLSDTGGTHSVITALQMLDRSRDSKEINIRIPIKEKVNRTPRTPRTPRFYSTLKPKNKYQVRLHHFSKEMDYMDLNYKEVLFYMVNDTYLNYLVSEDDKIKVMNYFRFNSNDMTTKTKRDNHLHFLSKELSIEQDNINQLFNEFIIKEKPHWITG